MKDNTFLWLIKPLRVFLRATKSIFFATMKVSQTHGAGAKIKNDLLNTIQRYKAARALTSEIKG
jgi:hypothetical protein